MLRALDGILTDAEIVDRIKNGLAMSDLRRAAVDVGYQSVVGKTTFEKLKEVKVPVVVGISPEGHDHFVVFRGTDEDGCTWPTRSAATCGCRFRSSPNSGRKTRFSWCTSRAESEDHVAAARQLGGTELGWTTDQYIQAGRLADKAGSGRNRRIRE